jgi:vancomycin resistance protein VanJ
MPSVSRLSRVLLTACVVFVALGIAGRSEFFLGTTFGVLRLPLLLVTAGLAARCLRRKEALGMTLGLAAAVAITGDWTADRFARAEPVPVAGETRSILTWNVLYKGGDPAKTESMLEASGADVIALQEISTRWEPRLLAGLAPRYPYWEIRSDDGTHGFALFSKTPIGKVGYHEVAPNGVIAQCADVDELGHLCNVHLTSPSTALKHLSIGGIARNSRVRAREWAVLRNEMHAHADAPARILAGDFNTMAADPLHREIARDWVDGFAAAGEGRGASWPAALPAFRIDYVWVQGKLAPSKAAFLPRGGSDHRGLTVEVRR